MDQVKAALVWLKQHHFWVLSVIVVGTVLGLWYTSSASVASQFKQAESKIKGEFSTTNGHFGAPFKPNDDVNREQQKEIQKLADDVLKEWTTLYQIQKENVLIWPKELGDRFINAVKDASFGDGIRSRLRELYQNYIKETFPSLVEIVDAELLDINSTSGRGGGGGYAGGIGGEYGGIGGGEYGGAGGGLLDPDPADTYLVEWLDQSELRSRFELDKQPTALQIWVLQEDLWVSRTLLQAIAATNQASGATRRDRAAVQTIVELKVGQSAAGDDPTASRLAEPDAAGAAISGGGFGGGEYGGGGGFGGGFEGGGFGGGYEGGGGGYGESRGGGFGGGPGGDAATGDDPAMALLTGRYLDTEDAPILTVTPGDYSFGREFKRLPVRLVLEMDTRWLSRLMWELANAPLQVEVEQVRFNPEGSSSSSRFGGGGGDVAMFDRRPSTGTVILQGVVYLFNKPDPTVAEVGGPE